MNQVSVRGRRAWTVGCSLVLWACGQTATSSAGGAADVVADSGGATDAAGADAVADVPAPDAATPDTADAAATDVAATDAGEDATDTGPAFGCGDGKCTSPETTATCPSDCPKPVCGDAFCQKPESGVTCALDCAPAVQTELACIKKLCPSAVTACSGDATCADLLGSALQCAADANGDPGAIEFCGTNLSNHPKSKALGEPACGFAGCASQTNGSVCGDGVCEGSESSAACSYDCLGVAAKCGDGACTGTETSTSCPSDCAAATVCGNGTCEPGEDSTNCAKDCPLQAVCGDGVCDKSESSSCALDCDAKLKAKQDCLKSQCGGEYDACAPSSACLTAITAWLQCAGKCASGNLVCVLGCQSTLGGNQDASALASCSNTKCP